MKKRQWTLGILALLLAVPGAWAQRRPYIGYVYPAGGQQGTSVMLKLGGQNLTGLESVVVSGQGVAVEVLHLHRRLSPQETTLLREQVGRLKASLTSGMRSRMGRDQSGASTSI